MDRQIPYTSQPADAAGHMPLTAREGGGTAPALSGKTGSPVSPGITATAAPGSTAPGTAGITATAAPDSTTSGTIASAAPDSTTSGTIASAAPGTAASGTGGTAADVAATTGTADSETTPGGDLPGKASDDKPAGRRSKKEKSRRAASSVSQTPVSAGSWFVTLMCMNIPVIGWIYLIILAFSRSAGAKRGFARAYLLYKFLFLVITLAILVVALHYGLELMDKVLAYMEML